MAAKYSMLLSVKTLGAQGIKRLGNSMQGLAGKVKNAKLTFDGLAKAYASFTVVQDTLNKSVQREESIRRLNLLAQGFDNLAAVQTAAGNAATKFGVSQTQANKEFAQIYARLRPIGLELEDIVTVYEGFNTAAKLSGTSASEASGAFLQLSQALGTGVLRGQELNSVFEQTPAVVQAIAKEMGVTVGEIRDLAKEGKVTIDYILPALERLRTEGAEKLTEAMKGPAQQFRNLNIAVEELQIAAIEDNLDGIVTIIKGITEGVKILNNVLKSKELEAFMNFIMFGFEGHPNKIKRSLDQSLTGKDLEDIGKEDQLTKLLDSLKEGNGDINTMTSSVENLTGSVKEMNNQWKEGAQEGLTQYREGMKDIATRVADMVVRSFKRMEDALVDYVMTGKLNFRDLANSIIRDMIRIQIQESITKPLSNWVGGLFGFAKGGVVNNGQQIKAFAKGGVIDSPHFKYMANGGIAVAGEGSGAEAILPLTRRNGVLGVQGGGNNTVVNVAVDASGSSVEGDDQGGRMLGQLIGVAVKSELIKQYRPGGLLNPA